MPAGLTLAQMEFLASKGLSINDAIELAKLGVAKSKGAERTARWHARRQGNATESVTSDVTRDASPPPIEDHTPPVSSNDETKAPPKTRQAAPAKPDGVNDQTWADFLALRKRKGAPLTATALAGIRDQADKAGWPIEAALAKCVTRGWQGFEAEWVEAKNGSHPRDGPASFLDHLTAKRASAGQ